MTSTWNNREAGVNVRQLEAFCKVIEGGSMSTAAQALGVTQPAITKSIRLLEESLQILLFKRSGDHLYPTMEAQRLYHNAKKIFEEIECTEKLSKQLKDGRAGTLKVAAAYTMMATFIPDAIQGFRHKFPLVDVQLMALPPRQIVDRVKAHEFDLGVLYEPIVTSNLQKANLCKTEMVCVASRDHAFAKKAIITANDLADQTVISYAEQSYGGSLLKNNCEAVGAPWTVAITVNHTAAALSLVASGMGIGVLDSLALTQEILTHVVVLPFRPVTTLYTNVIYASDRALSPLCKEFITALNLAVKQRLTRCA